MLEFKPQKIQFALFPKNLNLTNKMEIANGLKERLRDIFIEDPMILPISNDVSPELPRIVFESRNRNYTCKITPSRIDFFRQTEEIEEEFKNIKKPYLDHVKKIYSYFIEDKKLQIGRMGLVADFLAELNESSKKIIKEKLLNKNSYFSANKNITAINLLFVEKDRFDQWDVNKRIEIESMRKISEPENDKAIVLRYDINTLQEKIDEYNLTSENIELMLNKAFEEMENAKLNKFFEIKNE